MSQNAIRPYWILAVAVAAAALVGLGIRFHQPQTQAHYRSHFYDKTYVPHGTLE